MSARTEKLAEQFEQVNDDVISAVEATDEATWRAPSVGMGLPVGFCAWHIGAGHASLMGVITMIANGQPAPPITVEMLNAGNAAAAAEHANCTPAEVLALLRENGAAAAAAIRVLSEEQLDRTAVIELLGSDPLSVAQLIERALIGHAQSHLEGMRAAA